MKTSSKSGRRLLPLSKAGLLSRLQGGDRRSIGRSNEVTGLVLKHPRLFSALVEGMWHQDSRVRMRAADVVEKVSRSEPVWLKPFKVELLGLMAETRQHELRWHLALIAPRLPLTAQERRRAVEMVHCYLEDRSSIVKTFAMQGLADLASSDAELRPAIIELLRKLTGSGTPAMKARGRKLLSQLQP